MSKVKSHFDEIASNYDYFKRKNSYYYLNLQKLLKSLIPKGSTVLEVGTGTGELLSQLLPKKGVGFDISSKMISVAKDKFKKNKNLSFLSSWPNISNNYDYIFMSDVIEHIENKKETFNKISKLMNKKTKFICTMANPIWEPLLLIAEKFNLKMPEGPHNRIDFRNLNKLVEKSGMRIVKHDYKLLVPVKLPVISNFSNKYLERYFKKFAFIEYFVAIKA